MTPREPPRRPCPCSASTAQRETSSSRLYPDQLPPRSRLRRRRRPWQPRRQPSPCVPAAHRSPPAPACPPTVPPLPHQGWTAAALAASVAAVGAAALAAPRRGALVSRRPHGHTGPPPPAMVSDYHTPAQRRCGPRATAAFCTRRPRCAAPRAPTCRGPPRRPCSRTRSSNPAACRPTSPSWPLAASSSSSHSGFGAPSTRCPFRAHPGRLTRRQSLPLPQAEVHACVAAVNEVYRAARPT